MKKHIYLFRHGQTQWNLLEKMQGHKDIPLDETGLMQAQELCKKIKKLNISTTKISLYSSDLKRALDTAKVVFPDIPIKIHKGLREIDVGDFEGEKRNKMVVGHLF